MINGPLTRSDNKYYKISYTSSEKRIKKIKRMRMALVGKTTWNRRCGLVEGVPLKVGFEVSKAHPFSV